MLRIIFEKEEAKGFINSKKLTLNFDLKSADGSSLNQQNSSDCIRKG